MTEERPGFWEVFARRPSIVELAASALAFLMILVSSSNAGGGNFMTFLLLFLLCLALIGLWCLHWVAGLVARARGSLKGALTAREWLAWAVLPVLLFGGYVQTKLDVTLRLRFALSRTAFEKFDKEFREEDPTPDGLGLYGVESVMFLKGRPHVTTAQSGFMNSAGFVRWPYGPPESRGDLRYYHLTGTWYTFVWSD